MSKSARKPRFEVVVSAENTPYQAWQALLLSHSCLVRMGRHATVVVHGDEPALAVPFDRLIEHGGNVQRAPNHRLRGGIEYAARNTSASLLHAQVEADVDYLVLCDPDMVLLEPWTGEAVRLGGRQVGLDELTYLTVDAASRPTLEPACRRAGVPIEVLESSPALGGVPHVIPAGLQEPLAREWQACIACFEPEATPKADGTGLELDWHTDATMWSVLLAAHRLGLEPVRTFLADHNHEGDRPRRRSRGEPRRPWLHYCYGNAGFDKRWYGGDETDTHGSVWAPGAAAAGSVNARLFGALRAAAKFYGLAAAESG
jgi:hypothetical protein